MRHVCGFIKMQSKTWNRRNLSIPLLYYSYYSDFKFSFNKKSPLNLPVTLELVGETVATFAVRAIS